jgi:DNA-binding transcriptional LysR family regulator
MGPLRWDDLPLLLAAYRTRSLTQAALAMGLNQSTTSRRLSALEETLGTRLFERTPQGLVPTDAAHRMVEAAERAEAATHDAMRAIDGIERAAAGTVRLALTDAMSVYGIVPMLPRFRARHPDIVLSLVITNEIANLSRREADIAIRFVRPQRGDLVTKRVFEGPYALFAAPGVAARPHAELELVGWDESYEHLPESRWEHASGLRVAARATTVSARVAMAIAGVGAVALPRAFAALLDGVVEIVGVDVPLRAEAWLVTHAASREIPRVRATWEFVLEAFDEMLAER